ncbi:MAG: hypothetical protein JWQ95_6309 [Sphaerisporangium sp.]|nr:hypothetical protein [Sphaerisporangium sp.]
MDVTPPLAAGQSSRRPEPLSASAQPTGAALVLRRLGVAVAGLAVAALATAACVLSFDALRVLAATGGARADLAFLYPAGFDALLAIALISVLLLRPARLLVRLQAGLILALLIAVAAAVNVVIATGTTVDARQAAVAVAVVPWVMLVIGLWLFMLPSRRLQPGASRADFAEHPGRPEHDIVPFGGDERDPDLAPPLESLERVYSPHLEPAHQSDPDITPVVPPTAAPETPTVDDLPPLRDEQRIRDEPLAEQAPVQATPAPTPESLRPEETGTSGTAPQAATGDLRATGTPRDMVGSSKDTGTAPPDTATTPHDAVRAPEETDAASEQAVSQPEVAVTEEEPLGPDPAGSDYGSAVPEPEQAVAEQEHAAPEPEPEQPLVPKPRAQATPSPRPQRDPDLPLRWGDLVRPATGDVLVHPLPKPTRDPQPGDTQPYPQITDHKSEQPATDVSDDSKPADTQPYPHLREDAAPLPPGTPQDVDEGPDPAHDAQNADEDEAPRARRQPYTADTTAPPSGRMRSTPLPPEE